MSGYVVPAARRVGADLLGIAAPKTEKVLTGKKEFKFVAADVEEKILHKQRGGGKLVNVALFEEFHPKPVDSVELEEIFLLS